MARNTRLAVRAGIIIFALVFSGKLLAFGRDVAMSIVFGAGIESDAYFIANTIPGLLWAALYATISSVLLPQYVRAHSEGRGKAIAVEGVMIYSCAGLAMSVCGVVFAEYLVTLVAPQASQQVIRLASWLTVIMSVGFVFSGYVAVQNVLQQANGKSYAPLSVPVVNNIIGIVSVLVAAHYQDIAIAVVGAVMAWIAQAVVHRILNRSYYPFRVVSKVSWQTVRTLTLLSIPVMLGIFLDQINLMIGIYFAGALGDGAISHLSYGVRLALFVAGVFSFPVAFLIFPKLSEAAARGKSDDAIKMLVDGIFLILLTTIPLSAICFIAREDMVKLVFGGGAFGPADVTATSEAFAYYSIGIVFIALRELLNRFFFSQGRNFVPLASGLVATCFAAWASAILGNRMGLAGVAMGSSFGAILYTLVQIMVLRPWRRAAFLDVMTGPLAALAVATIFAWIAASQLNDMIEIANPFASFTLVSVVFSGVFLIVFAAVLRLVGQSFGELVARLLGPMSAP